MPSTAATTTLVDGKLERAVKELLDAGASLGDVIARLASSLATSVAAQLGVPLETAQQRLTQTFTRAFEQALRPSGTGPPQTNAERASSLVSRLRQIAELATRVTNEDTGQPIRSIAGTSLDAVSAKATPAPEPDHILREALAALAAPASSVTSANVASAVSVVPATANDGRTVALDPTAPAIATGGDTPLGRIIARALQSETVPATPASAPPETAQNPILIASAANGGTTSSSAILDAFVQSFAGALARDDASAARRDDNAVPFAISGAHEAASIAPPAPTSTLPQTPHVDANAIVDQILRGMAIRTTDGQSEVRLRLVPEQLGDVSVKLVVTGGSVAASITAHTADAQNALAGGQAQLAKTLADAGLKLQSFSVGLAGSFAGTRDQSRPNDTWTRSTVRRMGALTSGELDASDDPSLLAIPTFGPPIYAANSTLGAFNYLV